MFYFYHAWSKYHSLPFWWRLLFLHFVCYWYNSSTSKLIWVVLRDLHIPECYALLLQVADDKVQDFVRSSKPNRSKWHGMFSSSIFDMTTSLLMSPAIFAPYLAIYTNGIFYNLFGMNTRVQMQIWSFLLSGNKALLFSRIFSTFFETSPSNSQPSIWM